MIVVEWKLTTFLRQEPWLDAPPRTRGVARLRAARGATGDPTRAWWRVQPRLLTQKRGQFLQQIMTGFTHLQFFQDAILHIQLNAIKGRGGLSLTFHKLSKIFFWNLWFAEIILFVIISSWNFVYVPKNHALGTHTKFQLEILTINVISGNVYSLSYFGELTERWRNTPRALKSYCCVLCTITQVCQVTKVFSWTTFWEISVQNYVVSSTKYNGRHILLTEGRWIGIWSGSQGKLSKTYLIIICR